MNIILISTEMSIVSHFNAVRMFNPGCFVQDSVILCQQRLDPSCSRCNDDAIYVVSEHLPEFLGNSDNSTFVKRHNRESVHY